MTTMDTKRTSPPAAALATKTHPDPWVEYTRSTVARPLLSSPVERRNRSGGEGGSGDVGGRGARHGAGRAHGGAAGDRGSDGALARGLGGDRRPPPRGRPRRAAPARALRDQSSRPLAGLRLPRRVERPRAGGAPRRDPQRARGAGTEAGGAD